MPARNRTRGNTKHILVSQLGNAAENVSVDSRWTLGEFLESRGLNANDARVEGVRNGRSTSLKSTDKINGYDEIVIVPKVKGGFA